MKKIFLAGIVLLMASVTCMAQNAKYADLVVYRPAFKNYNAELHVGDKGKKQTLIRDKSGAAMKFPDEAAAVNYVAQQGWEVVSAWYNHHEGATHFLLKKTGN